jgi:hypothetical protein
MGLQSYRVEQINTPCVCAFTHRSAKGAPVSIIPRLPRAQERCCGYARAQLPRKLLPVSRHRLKLRYGACWRARLTASLMRCVIDFCFVASLLLMSCPLRSYLATSHD